MMIEKEMQHHSLFESARRAIEVIVRPPRSEYDVMNVSHICFHMQLPPIPRIPVCFFNNRNQRIVGSFYASGSFKAEKVHHCIIYLHGNIGSQLEGRSIVPLFAPRGISVFCFDFSGSGHSDGEYVTLGYNESKDVIDVVEFLSYEMEIDDFVLWGRSMGAAASIIASCPKNNYYCDNFDLIDRIKGIIVDSAFSSLDGLFEAIADSVKINSILKFLGKKWIKREVEKLAKFKCDEVSPVEFAPFCTKPMLIGHSVDDNFIPYEQAMEIYRVYGGEKEMVPLNGEHNEKREEEWLHECSKFVCEILRIPYEEFDVEISKDKPEHVQTFLDLLSNC